MYVDLPHARDLDGAEWQRVLDTMVIINATIPMPLGLPDVHVAAELEHPFIAHKSEPVIDVPVPEDYAPVAPGWLVQRRMVRIHKLLHPVGLDIEYGYHVVLKDSDLEHCTLGTDQMGLRFAMEVLHVWRMPLLFERDGAPMSISKVCGQASVPHVANACHLVVHELDMYVQCCVHCISMALPPTHHRIVYNCA